MPPRFAYWTILIDNAPTAFRARDRADLMGVFRQLANRNPNAAIRWFSNGRLWESPEQARAAARAQREPRGPEWRPGGRHEDPRARFNRRVRPPGRDAKPRHDANVRHDADPGADHQPPGGADRSRNRPDPAGAGHGRPEQPPWRSRDSRTRPERDRRDQRPADQRSFRSKDQRDQRPGDQRGHQPGEQRGHRPPDRRGGEPQGGDRRDSNQGRRDRKPWERRPGLKNRNEDLRGRQKKTDTGKVPGSPDLSEPPRPPGPERPPKPGQEPRPDAPPPETIRILPEPPERAGNQGGQRRLRRPGPPGGKPR
jgi:hypothetical protein